MDRAERVSAHVVALDQHSEPGERERCAPAPLTQARISVSRLR